MFIHWLHLIVRDNTDTHPTEAEWLSMDHMEFEAYRLDPTNNLSNALQITTTNPSTDNPGTVRPPQSTVTEFKKSIKRDPASYPTLQDQKHWNSWNRTMIAQARTHDVSEVFDRNYVPLATNAKAVELFQQKQGFIYIILNKCVLTNKGKEYV